MNDENLKDATTNHERAQRAELSRRKLLQLAGMGAGAAMVAPTLLGVPRSGIAQAATVMKTNVPDILRSGTYPVGFWWPPPPQETTLQRYAEIADAGFTFVTGYNGVVDLPLNKAFLDAAAANNLSAIVVDNRIANIQNYPRDQWASVVAATVRDYQPYPATTGFAIQDEPNTAAFAQIGAVTDLLRSADPSKLPFVNILPTYATPDQLGAPTYQDYLDRYVSETHPAFLSFDHYALRGPAPGLRPDYFYNWVLVRNEALRFGVPSWVFILACAHFDYRLPTEAELLWQVNVSLAYGCKGIQYFTYWTPEPPTVFRQGLISREGVPTSLYFAAQKINNDYLRPVGKQLLPLTSESVTHFGEATPPMGVEVFTGDKWVASASGNAVILSRFFDKPGQDKRWLLVANRSFDTGSTTTLKLGPAVAAAFEFDTTGRYLPLRLDGPPGAKVLQVKLAPGAARLFRLHDG